ncbi:GT4 family glycosyltransferase PelF [Paenibacillus sp. MSJ-34]|uniref:GT4 family glycosyltransferase PelF n=1 Tax=Paenibacillus sp. MSJ-34 TaxID=2841529 RepID=UPI001C105E3A|nr:GT4 family glycosyltransferase PelF [Paenibacillus sp. MSJ-34]MBU5442409.1 GT4 family glycosyltransferase PelF [Paenibacillus sp. MSJ-34]
MKIAIIAEGSYPYVTGGVSSWLHTLLQSMPEHEFVIYAIGAEQKDRGKFKYELPSNVSEIREVFLDSYLQEEGRPSGRYGLDPNQIHALKSLFVREDAPDWKQVFDTLRNADMKSVADFLMSRDFFDIIHQLCQERYLYVPFTEMFWTARSMVVPLFLLLREPVPQADLYHCVTTGYAGVIGSLAKHLYGKPMLLTEHGIYSREREEEIIKASWVKGYFKDLWIDYFYKLAGCAYHYADRVVTLFNRNREIEIELGCDPDKIQIVPNGIETADFAALPGKEPGDERIHIGAFVRIVPIKDIKTMVQSFALVKQEMPQASFYIMGPFDENEEYYEECVQLAEDLGLGSEMFTGNVPLFSYLGKMDVLALTSISEGQPLAVLEGMAAGKPFVATDVGSCKELLYGAHDDYGEAGIVVPVMNSERIASAILTLCRNTELRNRMGENGRKRVGEYYTKKAFIDAYKSLYQSCER